MAPERFRERRALLDLALDVLQDHRKVFVALLVAENVETLDQRQARVDHRREQAREGDQVFGVDTAAPERERE